MILTEHYQKVIRSTFDEVFSSGCIYLFGSRLDDNKKGGDIDLYLEINEPPTIDKKLKFLAKLKKLLGEQKIDLVFNEDSSRDIEKEIKKWAVKL
jgi:predicted nucleotidyltransferase